MRKLKLPVALLILLTSTGCASIISGTNQTVSFQSEPEGAEVIIDGQSFGRTPLSVSLAKNKYTTITFKKDGYKSQMIPLGKQFDGIAILNVFWDLSTTDLLTGAIYQYQPGSYYVELKPQGEGT